MDIKKYIYGHCISPVRVRTWDSLSGSYVVREVPCGKCLHCRNTHVNEWCTRLYAQSMYSKNVYFVTLDYAPFDLTSPVTRRLAAETAAVYHNINVTHNFGMHPLVLCKNHLQDFFKRLRRNTNKSLQYFACGEYGTHAGGKGFGRPHFHIILFSNSEFTPSELEEAWTINGYKIGRVDFHNLRSNGSFTQNTGVYSSKYVFRYVCKYLQKSDFDFEKLSTIGFHRTYYMALTQVCDIHPDLFSTAYVKNIGLDDYKWDDYCKDFAPFICCSKRPSIGLGYFNENKQRFTSGDFRLFGLPKECPAAFPRYYLKKTKEHLCPFMAFSTESDKVSSNSRIGYISSLLREIYSDRLSIEKLQSPSSYGWRVGELQGCKCLYLGEQKDHPVSNIIPLSSLHMYDYRTKIFYQFNGYGYNLWHKVNKIGYVRCGYLDIIDVINKLVPFINNLRENILIPFETSRVLQEEELRSNIDVLFNGSEDKFNEEAYRIYQDEISKNYKTLLLTKNSKLSL